MSFGARVALTAAFACSVLSWVLSCAVGRESLPIPSTLEKAPEDAPARMLHEEEHLRFLLEDGVPSVEITTRELRQVLRERGQGWRRFVVNYDRTFTTVEDAFHRVKRPDGSEKTLSKTDALDSPAFPGFVLYSDTRALVFDPPPVPIGTFIEAHSRVKRSSTDLFLDSFSFGGTIPTAVSRFVLDVPAGWEVEVLREQAGVRAEPKGGEHYQRESRDGGERWTFERKGLAAVDRESRDPGLLYPLETIFVRVRAWTDDAGVRHEAARDARAISEWVAERSTDRHQSTPALEQTVRKVLADIPAHEERRRAARLYAWVRDSIRYCAIEVGMGGWIPHAADSALELRYGDCKDKANLLKAMLGVAGIPSRTVQIYADEWPRPYRMPVLAGNFNHEILVVDLKEGPVFVDPTSRTTPFGDVPGVDEDRLSLPNAKPGHDLVETPRSDAERNVEIEKLRLALTDEGVARGTFESTMKGEPADHARHALLALPRKRHPAYYEDELAAMGPKITNLVVEGAAPPDEAAPLIARGDIAMPIARSGARHGILLRARTLLGSRLAIPKEEAKERATPYLLGERRSRQDEVVLTLPAHLRASRLPAEVVLDSPAASFTLVWRASEDGHTLTLLRSLVIKERIVPVASYAALRELARAALEAEAAPIAVVPAEGT